MTTAQTSIRWLCAAPRVVLKDSYAAVEHRVVAPAAPDELAPHIDWRATAQLRTRLAGHGMTIAEAMDTAQRQYLGWELARELIMRTGAQQLAHGFVAGAGAEQAGSSTSVADIVDAVVEQGMFIRACGGDVALLPLTTLSVAQASEATYCEVFSAIARELGGPLILHRLGAMFQPLLRHDFPGESFERILRANAESIRAVKMSLLDPEAEIALRRELLPREQFVLTGDDWNFGSLLCGGTAQRGPVSRTTHCDVHVGAITGSTMFGERCVALGDFSHGLLGVLDAIAAPVAAALPLLESGDAAGWMQRMAPLEILGRKLFEAPTGDYKAGLAHIAWRSGFQTNAMLLNHQELSRSPEHYADLDSLALRTRPPGD